MKKFMIACTLVLTLAIAGCGLQTEMSTSATTTRIQTSFSQSGDYEAAQIVELSFSNPEFNCTILDVRVDLLIGQIVVRMTIDDPEYDDYFYAAKTEPIEGTGGFSISLLDQWEESSTYEIKVSSVDNSSTYRFLVGRFPERNFDQHGMWAEAVAGFTIRIPSMWQRTQIGHVYFSFPSYGDEQSADWNSEYGRTRQGVSLSFSDPKLVVHSLTVLWYESETGRLAAQGEFPIDETRDDDGSARLTNLMVTGLKPGVSYRVVIKASGADAYADYVDSYIGECETRTDNYVGMWRVKATLYGYALLRQFDAETGYLVSVFVHDEGIDELPAADGRAFFLTVFDADDVAIYSVPVPTDEAVDLIVPAEYVRIGTCIRILDSTGTYPLSGTIVPFREPEVSARLTGNASGWTLVVGYREYDAENMTGVVEVLLGDEVVASADASQWISSNNAYFPIPDVPIETTGLVIRIHYAYEAFGGLQTVTVDRLID